nr:MAG TPA: hypothetical protein [Caudoviricetes sp.]
MSEIKSLEWLCGWTIKYPHILLFIGSTKYVNIYSRMANSSCSVLECNYI